MSNPSFETANRDYDNLLAGEFPRATDDGLLITGQNLARGALLGQITASGKWTLSLSASSDGSEVPRAVLAAATDATAADVNAPIYRSGQFNDAAVVFGTGHTAASTKEALADIGIYLKSNVPA